MSAPASSALGASPPLASCQPHTPCAASHHSPKHRLSQSSRTVRSTALATPQGKIPRAHQMYSAPAATSSHTHHQSPSPCHYSPSPRQPSRSQCHSRRTPTLVRSQQRSADNAGGQQQRKDSGVPAQAPGGGVTKVPEAEAAPPARRDWGTLSLWLFMAGFFLGAPLDGLHSVVGLQVYDGPSAIVIGSPVNGLLTSLWVFPLLGVMYVVVGALQLLLDSRFPPSPSVPASHGALTQMLTSLGVLVGLLRLSSLMFENELNPMIIFPVLLVGAHANWYAFDRTLPGYLLALLVATGAPISEVLFLKLGIWHYTTPDVFVFGEGLVSWTSCCYFFYTQWVATVARALDVALAPPMLPPGEGPKDRLL